MYWANLFYAKHIVFTFVTSQINRWVKRTEVDWESLYENQEYDVDLNYGVYIIVINLNCLLNSTGWKCFVEFFYECHMTEQL